MQKWEYLTLLVEQGVVMSANDYPLGKRQLVTHRPEGPQLHEFLNARGQEGWEVVAFDLGLIVLKRPCT